MEILITAAVVVGLLVLGWIAIHLLNSRARRTHLDTAPRDRGIAGFGDALGNGRTGATRHGSHRAGHRP
ncbi:hypothetical protein PZB75_12900 [Streptomyces sp. AM 4-1-1]|uniref:hypothetical protein n=1 Tax=Streptomyces sp. AM 4-1-1 TaxID=3028710 RepID=UPI0023B932A7|nr:hypothetical protein [Streptomyces sp. AM 4-1-1]WEH34181.1 hypothetical protein PZB75_12900 [Streptomyces sp. AM 4-1-1]